MSVPLYKFASNENIFVCKVTKVKCYKNNNTMVLCTLFITSCNTHYCVYIWTLMNILCIHLRSNQMENVFEDHNMTNPHLFRCDLVGHSLFMGVFFQTLTFFWRNSVSEKGSIQNLSPPPAKSFPVYETLPNMVKLKLQNIYVCLIADIYIGGKKRTK